MVYKNYLTTPSGRYCEISELVNADYLILLKCLQGENYQLFFQHLDDIVKRDLPDFSSYNIIDKCYIYMAYCMYSVRASITVRNKMLGDQEIAIALILNNIEKSFIEKEVLYELNDNFVLKFGLPTRFFFEGDVPIIDYYSGIKGYNNSSIKEEEANILKERLGTQRLLFIDDELRTRMATDCDVFSGVQMNSLTLNIASESLIANVIGFYKMNLESFYQIMYAVIRHIRMSYSDFMKITQVETNILLGIAAEENKRMTEDVKSNGNTNIGRPLTNG